ncbi:MAG: hypothetical protein LH629_12085, partial [Ignavibacteria bacterium]|nr:hypothetical protein [Ignavibacteria bacterium]
MYKLVQRLIFIVSFLLLSLHLFAQTDSSKNKIFKKPIFIHIKNIEIDGNRRTKDFIILRQLIFKQGDSLDLSTLMYVFNRCQDNLMNIGLFSEATLNLKEWIGFESNVLITVNERWYTLPAITYDIYDRNFNSWYVDHDHDWKRIQY